MDAASVTLKKLRERVLEGNGDVPLALLLERRERLTKEHARVGRLLHTFRHVSRVYGPSK